MKIRMLDLTTLATALTVVALVAADTRAASLEFVGSDYDIGGTFFPGGGDGPFVVVPWRTETASKAYDLDGDNVYGSAGYAMFATQFVWPNTTCCGSTQPFDSATWPNKIDLPSFVTGSQALTDNIDKVGGWNYALVDDPELVNGYRDFNWGNTLSPPVDPPNSQSPYVKIGILEGIDVYGNNPRTAENGAGRWEFTVGEGVPNRFRVGVMADGLDANHWSSTEVLLHQVDGASIVGTAATGTLPIGTFNPYSPGVNRFVDIHTFDIVGAQPGDTFAIYSKAFGEGWGGVSAVTFDLVPEPTGVALFALALGICGGAGRINRRK